MEVGQDERNLSFRLLIVTGVSSDRGGGFERVDGCF